MPKLNEDYNIGQAFAAIEEELIQSMIRNMKRHRVEEIDMEMQWEMWQAKQLDALEKYKRNNRKKYKDQFLKINDSIEAALEKAYIEGGMEQEIEILKEIQKRYGDRMPARFRRLKERIVEKLPFGSKIDKDYFQVNDKRLDALIHATTSDMKTAESAMLRMADDQYRKIIFNAQVYAATGAGTYEKAVDMATKDFLAAGINCIEYKDGRRVNISSYASMAIRTADKRTRLYADGEVRKSLGIHTVITKKRTNACPKCLPFVDKILIDDVWSGGSKEDGPYPLLSQAMEAGFLHPNCKDHFTTYIPGVTEPPEGGFSEEEIKQAEQNAVAEAEQQYAERQVQKYNRLAEYSLDEKNQKRYAARRDAWKTIEKPTDAGIINLTEEEAGGLQRYKSFDSYTLNEALREVNDLSELTSIQQQFVDALDSALSKMPKYEGNLIRTIDFSDWPDAVNRTEQFLKEYIPGGTIKIKQYWSASKEEGYNNNAGIKIYIQNTRNGRDISSIGLDEKEVLYERNSRFKVLSKMIHDGIWYILLQEV